MSKLDILIEDLAADLEPVRPQSMRLGRLALAAVAILTLLCTFAFLGLREDVARLNPAPLIGLAAGLMSLLAIAAGVTAIRMARPQVGPRPSGAPWVLAALLLLPSMVLVGIAAEPATVASLHPSNGFRCLVIGIFAAIATIAFLYVWQRHGAPVRPNAAAWYSGLCGGAVGALAVTLECGGGDLGHLGIWHVAVVPIAGVATWLLLPRFVRW